MKTIVVIWNCFVAFTVGLGFVAAFVYARRQRLKREQLEQQLTIWARLPAAKANFDTPEGAILCLERAYQKFDIEAAVQCHSFEGLATVWFTEFDLISEDFRDRETIAGLAATFERDYRTSIPWPREIDWRKAKSYFLKRECYGDELVAVTKVAVGPNGVILRECILVGKTAKGWRVFGPLAATSKGWRMAKRAHPSREASFRHTYLGRWPSKSSKFQV